MRNQSRETDGLNAGTGRLSEAREWRGDRQGILRFFCFKVIYLCVYWDGGRGKSQVGSTPSAESDMGLEPTNHETMT